MASPTEIKVISPGKIEVAGTKIFIDYADNDSLFRNKRRSDAFYMAKSLGYIESYNEVIHKPELNVQSGINILEFGIFAGGSAVFIDKVFDPQKLVCIDYMPQTAPALERYIHENGAGRIETYYGTDQGDKGKIQRIIEQNFTSPIDIIVDDASHLYDESRSTFEATFPYLRDGGLYILEDWSWAHNAGAENPDHPFAGFDALTNLVLRLVMLHGCDLQIIRRMGFGAGLMWVQKGAAVLPETGFSLTDFERPRGRELALI